MLKKTRRLRAAEVARISRSGKNYRGRFLSAKALPGPDGTMRIAAAVSKSVARKAVERNHLRRALYRAIAGLPSPVLPAGHHIVFFVRISPKESPSASFAEDIARMFPTS